MKRYNPSDIEPKWQAAWDERQAYVAHDDSQKQKFYISCMFPYPSGAGMHTGHAFEHAIVDAIARFHRAHGKEVLNPMGWDTFGLPAENYAIKTGTAPAEVTKTNIANFKNQIRRMGASIDWSREINTSDPEYYRWTQWIFAEFFKRGLAYQKESLQWWCPVDKTVLANEQVESGKCWRCGTEVVKKSMNQWFFKITQYADALLDEIEDLDWPGKIKTAQTNWIGRSEGAEIDFALEFANGLHENWSDTDGKSAHLTVFTTRPDTIFGATYLVVAPEHSWVAAGLKLQAFENNADIQEYVTKAQKKSEIERQTDTKDKTGVMIQGVMAVNPANGEKIPVWVADYVLGGYGTGAIMAVPAHDERDLEFAEKYHLPVRQVVAPYEEFEGDQKPRDDVATVERVTADAIIRDEEGNYLIQIEGAQKHFVGGGIDEGESIEAALRREVLEETGYTDIASVRQIAPIGSGKAYRHTKDVNQRGIGYYFEVVLASKNQVRSEVDDGKHEIEWVEKKHVRDMIDWSWQRDAWDAYIRGDHPHVYVGEGVLVNSGAFDRKPASEAREEIVAWLEQQGVGKSKTTYKMRDWLISRQRYWGAPIPIIHCDEHGAVAVPADQLPVLLPEVKDYAPKGDGKSVLASETDWVNTTCPTCGRAAKRETDTMDGYACSSWYLLRYSDPHNNTQAWAPEKANMWAPVDYYVGGDHAVAHLLYVRFWTHVFNEMGLTDFKEPVKKLVYHGYINAEDGTKMSKSKGNVIDPLDIIDQGYGADALRTYVLFMGPIEDDAPWDSRGIAGIYRFLNRVWTLTQEFIDSEKNVTGNDATVRRLQHKTVRKTTDDYRRLSFNTAISALMEYTNELYKLKTDGFSDEAWREALGVLARLLAPLAPHMSAELWQQLDNESSIEDAGWPQWDEALTMSDTKTVIVQVNGKLRAKLTVSNDESDDAIKAKALQEENVVKFTDGKQPAKVIYVSGKLVNIVVS